MKIGEEVMAPTAGAARRMRAMSEATLEDLHSDVLLDALTSRRSVLTPEQRGRALAVGLDLCGDCAVMLEQYFPARGFNLMQYVRRMLWKYLRSWAHGAGCPKDS